MEQTFALTRCGQSLLHMEQDLSVLKARTVSQCGRLLTKTGSTDVIYNTLECHYNMVPYNAETVIDWSVAPIFLCIFSHF